MITDYTSLKEAVLAWLEREGDTALSGQINTIISLAESWLRRQLAGYQREIATTLTTDGTGAVALPIDFIGVKGVSLANVPYSYSISGTTLVVARGASRTFDVVYYGKLPGLSETNPTNWLLSLAPDVYLYACLARASAFAQDWQNAAIYEGNATEALTQVNMQNAVAQYGRSGMNLPVRAF